MNTDQTGMFFTSENQPACDYVQLHAVIVDRGSKYSVTAGRVESEKELKAFVDRVKQEKSYAKATHNSYAARFAKAGQVIERKADDGEVGAGMVILRTIRSANMVNVAVVVTRWFGGTKLFHDRFTHVQNATREVLHHLMD